MNHLNQPSLFWGGKLAVFVSGRLPFPSFWDILVLDLRLGKPSPPDDLKFVEKSIRKTKETSILGGVMLISGGIREKEKLSIFHGNFRLQYHRIADPSPMSGKTACVWKRKMRELALLQKKNQTSPTPSGLETTCFKAWKVSPWQEIRLSMDTRNRYPKPNFLSARHTPQSRKDTVLTWAPQL